MSEPTKDADLAVALLVGLGLKLREYKAVAEMLAQAREEGRIAGEAVAVARYHVLLQNIDARAEMDEELRAAVVAALEECPPGCTNPACEAVGYDRGRVAGQEAMRERATEALKALYAKWKREKWQPLDFGRVDSLAVIRALKIEGEERWRMLHALPHPGRGCAGAEGGEMTRKQKLATLFSLLAHPEKPSELRAETRVLLGLPKDLPSGGYSIEDVILAVPEVLAELLA